MGIKSSEQKIVLEYMTPSNGKRFHHSIKLAKYYPGILIQQLSETEVNTIVDKVFDYNKDYFTDKVTREDIAALVSKISRQ